MVKQTTTKKSTRASNSRFEAARIDSLFVALDAIAWMNSPTAAQIAQYANIDPRTVGKLLKNALQIGLVEKISDKAYALILPYPYKGSLDQKQTVVREALVRLPLLASVRQFMRLGDSIQTALRKSATIAGISPFNSGDFGPLLEWAHGLNALKPDLTTEDLIDAASSDKADRHKKDDTQRVAFLSHSSLDKPFIRQLAADLTTNGVSVWLDEQRIRVGDSIPEKIAQGLAASDYFLIAVSHNSSSSEWVNKELNNALVNEVQRRKVHILPLKLDDSTMPIIIPDKKYADFSQSYKKGLEDLLTSIKGDIND